VPLLFTAISAVFLNTPIRAGDNLDFSVGGGTMDAGAVAYYDSPKTWTVTLPDNVSKVETIHYDKANPSNMRKYMGWQGSLKVNGDTVWEFKRWSSATGGIVYDGVVGQEVRESTGIGQWIDATKFFSIGPNTVIFAHYNEGAGIGLKIRVTTGAAAPPPAEIEKKSDSAACSAGSECEGGYCVHGACRSTATYCGDNQCDNGEDCSGCTSDCGACPAIKKLNGESCTEASECDGGYCVHNACRSSATYCGDNQCDSGEDCSGCSNDCGACSVEKKLNGESCAEASECDGGYCVHNTCRSAATYCGDNQCDSGEDCANCVGDCGDCPVTAPTVKKINGASCSEDTECDSGYCVHGTCRATRIHCGDGHCDTNAGEKYARCQADCPKPSEQVLTYKADDTVTVDEFGEAKEVLEVRFPPEEWDADAWRDKTRAKKELDRFGKQLLEAAKEAGFDASQADVALDARQRLLKFSITYRAFAFPATRFGLEDADRWAISPVGIVLDLDACRPNDFTVIVKKNDVVARAQCEQAFTGAEKVIRSHYVVQRIIHLPAQASEITYDETKSLATYRITKVANGGACTTKSDCASGNCRNGRCCTYGQNCCWPAKTKCPAGQYCFSERFACVPTLENGNKCTVNNQCKSGNCGKGVCCAKGKKCCKEDKDCGANAYCEAWETYSCIAQKDNGKKCGQPRECKSGYCDVGKCAAAPKPVSIEPAAPGSEDGISLIAPASLFLSKAESRSPAIRIQNSGEKEVLLLEKVQVRNSDSDVVGANQNALRIVKGQGMESGLATGEVVGTESEDLLSSIDALTLTGKKQGQSEIELRAGYTIDGQTKWLTTKVQVIVSGTNIRQEPVASAAFGEDMLFREKRSVRDTASGKTKDVIFVEPEDDSSYQASLGAWKLAETTFNTHLANLWNNFKGSVEPGVVSFFSSAQKLAQAKTPDEITEQALRAIAPSVITSAFDFLRMGAAVQEQEREERAFLNRFKAKEFARIPIVDAKGKVTGYAKAVVKERGGKWYAVKIGEH
jgi:hypothetical protein